jgi:zinc transporter ZupT
VISQYSEWARARVLYFVAFAAGVLITASFLNVVPEAFEKDVPAQVLILVGFFVLYLSDHVLERYLQSHSAAAQRATIGLIPLMSITFHSFVDGIIYAVTFKASILLGTLAAIGMVMHEFSEGIVSFVLLEEGGFECRKARLYAFLGTAVSTPLGTLVAYPFIDQITGRTLGIALSLAAGALVYVGAAHLLPRVREDGRTRHLLTMGAGIAVAAIIHFTAAH